MVSTLEDMRKWAVSLATGSLLMPEVWKEATTDMVPFVFSGNGPPGAVRPPDTNAPPSPGLQKPVASSPITGTIVNAS